MKKILKIVSAAILLCFGMAATASAASTSVSGGRIDTVTLSSGNTAYIYVPENKEIGRDATATPILVVYGNKTYTEQTALLAAQVSGLGRIALDELGVVVFVNPKETSWSASDTDSIAAIKGLFSDSTNNTWVNGKYTDDSGKTYYPGWGERFYVFADGSGADFVSKYITCSLQIPNQYISGKYDTFVPAFTYLSNASVEPSLSTNNMEVPAFLVNPYGKSYQLLAGKNEINFKIASGTSTIKNDFDPTVLYKAYIDLGRTCRRSNDHATILDLPAKSLDIKRSIFTTSSGKDIAYYAYVGDGATSSIKGSVPLVVTFHGSGNHALTQLWTTEWPQIADQEGFMVVSVNDHYKYTEEELAALLDYLFKDYSFIDTGRVYASGFSMGSMRSFSIGMSNTFSKYFAAIAPTNIITTQAKTINPNYSNCPDITSSTTAVPTIYFAGETSVFAELPHQAFVLMLGESGKANIIDNAINYLFKRNHVTDHYEYDAAKDAFFGWKGDYTKIVKSIFPGVISTAQYYKSKDGNVYTALVHTSNVGHEPLRVHTELAWGFMSKFSRIDHCSITVTSATYTGSAVETTVVVKDGKDILTKNVDYTLVYSNNKKAGTATVTVYGKGNYSGSIIKKFTIKKL